MTEKGGSTLDTAESTHSLMLGLALKVNKHYSIHKPKNRYLYVCFKLCKDRNISGFIKEFLKTSKRDNYVAK